MTVIGLARLLNSIGRNVRTLSNANIKKSKIGVIGVPFGKGQNGGGIKEKGLELAPDAIRETSLLQDLRSAGYDVKDYGNVVYSPIQGSSDLPSINFHQHVIPNLEKLSDTVSSVISSGRIALTLGGDHSLAAGTIHGHLQIAGEDNVAVVYVDAHADINIPSTTPTGNVHGMCISLASDQYKKEWSTCPGLEWQKYRLPLSNLAYIGLRSVDAGEAEIIRDNKISAYFMNDITRLGIAEVIKRVMNNIDPCGSKFIHISLDTDSLDPSEAPSTTLPVRGGLLLREVLYLAEELSQTGRVQAVDLVEFNPLIGTDNEKKTTLDAVKHSILACFGVNAR